MKRYIPTKHLYNYTGQATIHMPDPRNSIVLNVIETVEAKGLDDAKRQLLYRIRQYYRIPNRRNVTIWESDIVDLGLVSDETLDDLQLQLDLDE